VRQAYVHTSRRAAEGTTMFIAVFDILSRHIRELLCQCQRVAPVDSLSGLTAVRTRFRHPTLCETQAVAARLCTLRRL
jgi:hypothetical protein